MANIEASVSGDWHTGSNWVGGVVPTATDVAILNGKVMTLVEGASITCSSIEGGTALESLVNAIKAKTDLLSFVGYETVITGDAHAADVSVLLHFDDSFSTHNGLAGTVSGNVTLDTTEKVFGTASAKFNGGIIQYATAAGTAFGTGDFTVEAWVRHDAFSTAKPHLLSNVPAATYRAGTWSLMVLQNQIKFVEASASSYPGAYFTLPTPLTVNTWRHIAVTRSNGTAMLFIDGVLIGSQPLANDFYNGSYLLTVGTGTSYNAHYGHMDEIRITKNAARYTDTFTVPTMPFSTVAGTAVVEIEGVEGNAILECKGIDATDYTDDLQQIKNLVVAGLK